MFCLQARDRLYSYERQDLGMVAMERDKCSVFKPGIGFIAMSDRIWVWWRWRGIDVLSSSLGSAL